MLLAEGVESGVVVGECDVVSAAMGWKEAVGSGGGEAFFGDDPFQESLGILVEFLGDFGPFFVFSFEGLCFGIPNTTELPGVEERSPVDVVGKLAEGLRLDHAGSGEFGDGWLVVRPIDGSCVLAGFFERNGFFS